MDRKDQILRDSAEIEALRRRVLETVRYRGESPEATATWRAACKEFHERFGSLFFPGGGENLRKVKDLDPTAIDAAIDFLLADPVHFRSGYIKEDLWRRAHTWRLNSGQLHKLEKAARSYLEKRIRRDFWYMCRAMARIANPSFWQDITSMLVNENEVIAKRASYLFTYNLGIEQGENLHRQVRREVLKKRFARN